MKEKKQMALEKNQKFGEKHLKNWEKTFLQFNLKMMVVRKFATQIDLLSQKKKCGTFVKEQHDLR